jgi:hypothetical protein
VIVDDCDAHKLVARLHDRFAAEVLAAGPPLP